MAEDRKKSESVSSPAHIAAAKSAASQRRHALEKNTLKDQLNRVAQAFKEPSRTTWLIAGILVVGLILFFVWRHFHLRSEERDSNRSLAFLRDYTGEKKSLTPEDKFVPPVVGLNEEQMKKFAKDNEGTIQARIADFEIARHTMAKGQSSLITRGEAAMTDVREAAELYEKLVNQTSDTPVLHMEAMFGAAKARETLGEFDKAIGFYQQLIKTYPKSAFVDKAKAAEEQLKSGTSSRTELEELAKKIKG